MAITILLLRSVIIPTISVTTTRKKCYALNRRRRPLSLAHSNTIDKCELIMYIGSLARSLQRLRQHQIKGATSWT